MEKLTGKQKKKKKKRKEKENSKVVNNPYTNMVSKPEITRRGEHKFKKL